MCIKLRVYAFHSHNSNSVGLCVYVVYTHVCSNVFLQGNPKVLVHVVTLLTHYAQSWLFATANSTGT